MVDLVKGQKFKIKDDVPEDYWYEAGQVFTFDHYIDDGCGGRGIVTEELIAEGYTRDDVWVGEDDIIPLPVEGSKPLNLDFLDLIEAQIKSSIVNTINFSLEVGVNNLVDYCHTASSNAGWWVDKGGNDLRDNPFTFSNKLMLTVSELSEAREGDRKDLMDDKLPHRKMAEVELADALIRICDLAGAYGFDLGGAVVEKMNFNKTRQDHSKEARGDIGGKKY